jgi:hypothetical protein
MCSASRTALATSCATKRPPRFDILAPTSRFCLHLGAAAGAEPDLTVVHLRVRNHQFDIRFWRHGETRQFDVLRDGFQGG